MKNVMLILFLGIILFSCRERDLPKPATGEPIFYVDGIIDGGPKRIVAGEDNYYLYTSFSKDSSDLYTFSGKFEQVDCQNCKESLTISINNFEISPGAIDIEQALQPGPYGYKSKPQPVFMAKFTSEPEGVDINNVRYAWNFGDGTQDTSANPVHTFQVSAMQTDSFNVSLVISSGIFCSSSIQNNVDFSTPQCKSYFTYPKPNTTQVQFTASPTGKPPFTYSWTTGGIVFSNSPMPTYSFNRIGIFEVCLAVTDKDNCYSQYCRNVNVLTQNCVSNFSYTIDTLLQPNSFSQITIQWVDPNGKLFTSDLKAQPQSSYFNIINSEGYKNNERGERVQKIDVEFDCWVYNNSDSLRLSGVKGVTAVAYP